MTPHIGLSHTVCLSHRHRGFTLLEILLAVSILSVVATVAFATLRSVMGNMVAVSQISEADTEAGRCMSRMIQDLSSIHVTAKTLYDPEEVFDFPDPNRVQGGIALVGDFGESAIRFSSRAHLPLDSFPSEGIAEIVYYAHETESGEMVLRRSDRLSPLEPAEPSEKDPILCRSLEEIQFVFFDNDSESYSYWDSDSEEFEFSTPSAVGIKLRIARKDGISPVYITHVYLPSRREPNEGP